QVIAAVVSIAFVLHHPLVAARAAVEETRQERWSGSWNAASLIAIVLGIGIAKPGLDFLKGRPGKRGRILIVDANLPFVHRQVVRDGSCRNRCVSRVLGTAGNEGSGISRVVENREDGADGRRLPNHIAKPVLTRQEQLLLIEILEDLARGATWKKSL